MSLVITVIFLIISFVIQQTQHLLPFSQIDVPGIGQNMSSLIIIITVVIAIIFLIRALSDALFLGDILIDIVASLTLTNRATNLITNSYTHSSVAAVVGEG